MSNAYEIEILLGSCTVNFFKIIVIFLLLMSIIIFSDTHTLMLIASKKNIFVFYVFYL